MELITQIITAIFVILVFFGVIVGIFTIGLIAIIGMFKGLHNKNTLTVVTSVVVIIVMYVGITALMPKISNESTQVEVTNAANEEYIHEWIFPDENVAIEQVPGTDIQSEGNKYYVITENDSTIYIVTLYPEKAFGLNKYKVEYFNEDERLLESP